MASMMAAFVAFHKALSHVTVMQIAIPAFLSLSTVSRYTLNGTELQQQPLKTK